jgi:hypothetical protein
MTDLGRRALLKRLALASAGTAALAGCTVQSGNGETEVLVVTNNPDEMLDGTLEDALGETVEVSPVVHNPGSAGDIEVTITAEDDGQTELASTSEVFSFEQGEQKEVTVEMTIPSNTTYLAAEASRVSGNGEPEVIVVTNNPDEMLDGTLEDALGETVEVSPIVHNPGSAGDIEVTITAEDDGQTELASTSREFAFEQDEQKRVTLEMTIPNSTADLAAEASRA